jgi:glucoamylase
LGIYIADFSVKELSKGTQIKFTFYWPDADRWEGTDFIVSIRSSRPDGPASAEKSEKGE